MLRAIVYIHGDDEDHNVGHHERGHEPGEPAPEEAEVVIVRGGGIRRRRQGSPGGGVPARMDLDLDVGRRWVAPRHVPPYQPFGKRLELFNLMHWSDYEFGGLGVREQNPTKGNEASYEMGGWVFLIRMVLLLVLFLSYQFSNQCHQPCPSLPRFFCLYF